MAHPVDTLGRSLRSLRLSVTDRCNLRCRYCMPEEEYVWLPRSSILTFEELERLTRVFCALGVDKLRLTGGEPLLRHDLPDLVRRLAGVPGVSDLALTTNAVLLPRHASALRVAGLQRVTVSLDTLRADRFRTFGRSVRLETVLRGIDALAEEGFTGTKLNAVLTRGFNDDETADLLRFGIERKLEVRFIEYMDVGGATGWSLDQVVSREEILRAVAAAFGPAVVIEGRGSAPANRYRLPDGTVFGIVASTTAPFCRACDRARLTADGLLYLCLYADTGIDLRTPLRDGATDDELAALIARVWRGREDRGAEIRRTVPDRGVLHQLQGLRSDPHREMHTRGG